MSHIHTLASQAEINPEQLQQALEKDFHAEVEIDLNDIVAIINSLSGAAMQDFIELIDVVNGEKKKCRKEGKLKSAETLSEMGDVFAEETLCMM